MSPAPTDLRALFRAAARGVRRDALLAAIAVVAAVAPATLLLAWAIGSRPAWAAPSPWPLVADLAAIAAAAGAALWARRRWVDDASADRVGAAAERARGLPAGALRGVLELAEALPRGTSAELARGAEARLRRLLAGADPRALGGDVGRRSRRRRRGAVAGLVALASVAAAVGFTSPRRARAGWSPLLRPVSTLSAPPLPPLLVEPGNAQVRRGAALPVRVRAPGRSSVRLAWQPEGDVRHDRELQVLSGAATSGIPAIDARTRYWVEAPDGAVSDTFAVTPEAALLVASLSIELRYPAYLRREPERFEGEVPSLDVPEGASITFRGHATRPLGAVRLVRADSAAPRVVVDVPSEGADFSGRWTPRESGRYEWRIRGADDAPAEVEPAPLDVRLLADAAPAAQLTYPGVDTVLTAEMRQPLAVSAADDHGVAAAELVSWRVSALGDEGARVRQRLDVEGDPERVLLQGLLDASGRGLLPGDTLFYFVRVTDNSPRAQTGVTRTYRLRLPSMAERREDVARNVDDALDRARQAADEARDLEKATSDLARRGVGGQSQAGAPEPGGSPQRPGSRSGDKLDFAQAQEAQKVMERQEKLLQQAESLQKSTDALRKSMEAAGLADPELKKRLDELSKLYQDVLTPELRARLDALKQALARLDPERVNEALSQLSQNQQEFRQQMEESLQLLRRAAAEQQMSATAQEARELAAEQRSLSDAMRQDPPPDAARREDDLAGRASELRQGMQDLQKRLEAQGEKATAAKTQDAGDLADQAKSAMQQASAAAAGKQPQQASQSGAQAASRLESAASTLEQSRDRMAAAWRKEVQQAVDQAASDALALAERQNALLQEMKEAAAHPGSRSVSASPRPPQGTRADQPPVPPQPRPPSPPQSGQSGQSGQSPSPSQAEKQGAKSGGKTGAQQGGKQAGGQSGEAPGRGAPQQPQQAEGSASRASSGSASSSASAGSGTSGSAPQPVPSAPSDPASIRAEQAAVQQGLEALGRNLAEAGRRSAMVNRDVGAALGRAALSMRRTVEAMEDRQGERRLPVPEATRSLDALNRLALSLLGNQQEIAQSQAGTGLQQALEQLARMAQQQGSLNAQTGSLLPLQLQAGAMKSGLQRIAQSQRGISRQLDQVGKQAGSEGLLGDVEAMKQESDRLARDLEGGRITPEIRQRQETLFHRLLDAGHTLERDEVSQERVAERPGDTPVLHVAPLDPARVGSAVRYPAPDPEQLRGLPPAYRRLILEYFERLNRAQPPAGPSPEGRP